MQVTAHIRNVIAPMVGLLTIGVIWEASVIGFNLPAYLLPPPSEVIYALVENFVFIMQHLFITLRAILLGFSAGAVLGVLTAALIVYSPLLGQMIYPIVVITQSIPKVTIAPILLVWFGIGMGSKHALIILMVYFPVVVNTVTGLSAVEPYALDLMRSLQARRLQVFWMLRLPNALLGIFDGLKLGVTMSIIAAILSEFIGSSEGIGWLILVAKTNMDLSLSFAGIAVIAVAAITMFGLVGAAQRFFVHWQRLQ